MTADAATRVGWKSSHLDPLRTEESASLLGLFAAWRDGHRWPRAPLPFERSELLWQYAERQGLGGIVGSLAAEERLTNRHLEIQGHDRYLSNVLHASRAAQLWRRIHNASRKLGVPIAFVKGPTLVRSAWKDEGIRSFGDLDIFLPSAEAAEVLVADLKGDADPHGPLSWSRMSPGKAHLEVDGWQLELCVPMGPPRGPAFEMMARHPDRLFSLPESDEAPAAPEPSFHFVFMLQHLMQHRCSRLIWSFDLAAFHSLNRDHIDVAWVAEEIAALEHRSAAWHVGEFIRNSLEGTFPDLGLPKAGWNTPMHRRMTEPDTMLRGELEVFHRSWWRRQRGRLADLTRHLLITDAASHHPLRSCAASRWTATTFTALSGKIRPALARWLERPVFWVTYTAARLVSRHLTTGQRREVRTP